MAGVPCYRLPKLHAVLKQRGFLDETTEWNDYRDVFTAATAVV